MRRPSVIALIAITIVFVVSTLPANAWAQAAEAPGSTTIIALDYGAASSPTDLVMMETALMMLAGNLGDGEMTVVRYGVEISDPVTAPAGTDVVTIAGEQLALVKAAKPPLKSDQFDVLTKSFSFLTRLDAESGSRAVLITPGRLLGESENTTARLKSVGDLYANGGWTIDVVTLPSTVSPLRDLLRHLSTSSGGRYFDLGTPEGLQALLFQASDVDLETVIDAELNGIEVTSTFEVAPLTDTARIAFLRLIPDSEVALFRPNGTQVTSELKNVEVIESPNVVIFSIKGPAAGTWTANAIGERGKLITGVDTRTPLTVQLLAQPPLPLAEPGLLTAAAMIAEKVTVVPGTRIDAVVRQTDGFANVYQMNDEGLAGDATAADGIFSVRLPSPQAQGINDVALTMSWANLKSNITGIGSYQTELFPALRVTRMFDINIHEGEEAVVATVESFVGDFPYLASPNEFSVTVVGIDAQAAGRLRPRSEPELGKGFAFDVLASVPVSGDYAISVVLNTNYLGRQYFAPSPAISSSAIITPFPFLILGLPVWAWSVIGAVALIGLVIVIVQSRKVHPHGYIYDDQDNLLVDFAKLGRSWARRFRANDRVLASEIQTLPFRSGTFKFTRGGVKLEYDQSEGQPSLRVNSRPAANVVELEHDVWLGINGMLLTFTAERRPRTSLVFAPADD